MAKAKGNFIIAKFQTYPATEPTGYAVGFSVKHKGRSAYQDTVVPFTECEGLTEEEICDLAFANVGASLQAQVAVFDTKGEIVGQKYTPIADRETEPEAEPEA
jgi:hypothetical protein